MFGFGSKKFVGVDIGTSSIKIIELEKKGDSVALSNYGEVRTSVKSKTGAKPFEKNNLLLSSQSVASAIKSVYKEAGIVIKNVNFSIPDFSSFFTAFDIPKMSKEEIPETIKYEVRPYIPLPITEITLDWNVTQGTISKTPLKVLVVAIPNEIITQYKEIAHFTGLKLQTLEPEAFALARAVVNKEDKGVIGLIDIGARSTTCSILEDGIVKISHSFNLASNQLTERLAGSLNISTSEAEELKRKYGLTLNGRTEGTNTHNVREILVPMVDSITEEIKKIFRSFYQNQGKEVDKIILSGGISRMPGLKEYFFAELRKETIIADPFKNISYPPSLKNILANEGPSYAVAIGLALKGFE